MGFILMYDITNEESFNSVQDWVTQIKTYSWDNAQVILVGNKCDMEEERVISADRGRQLAEQLGVRFFETSAKENINVKVCGVRNSGCVASPTINRLLVPSSDKEVCPSHDADPAHLPNQGIDNCDIHARSVIECREEI